MAHEPLSEDSLAAWVQIPAPDTDAAIVGAWADSAVAGRAPAEAAAVAALVRSLAPRPLAPGASWRFLHVIDPMLGAALWEVTFLAPDSVPAELVKEAAAGQLGGSSSAFIANDIHGMAAQRFDLDADEDGHGDRQFLGEARIATTRDLPGLGFTSVLATARTGHLDSLAASIEPMQYLLTSDYFAELVADTIQTRPATDPDGPPPPTDSQRGTT